MAFIVFILLSFLLQGALGEIICEELPTGLCAFSVASSGQRCVLENYLRNDGNMEFECKTSDIFVKNLKEGIESDECMNACGLRRNTVGIASDALLEPKFIAKLCSHSCYNNCPNIVDLYHHLAIGEGVFLGNLCEANRKMPRRAMAQVLSSGAAASAPADASSASIAAAEPPFNSKSFHYASAYAPSSI